VRRPQDGAAGTARATPLVLVYCYGQRQALIVPAVTAGCERLRRGMQTVEALVCRDGRGRVVQWFRRETVVAYTVPAAALTEAAWVAGSAAGRAAAIVGCHYPGRRVRPTRLRSAAKAAVREWAQGAGALGNGAAISAYLSAYQDAYADQEGWPAAPS